MANRFESRISKLERIVSVSQNGCIIYFENAERGTATNADGDEVEVFIGGNFTIGGSRMNIDELNAHLIDVGYQASVYLPVKRVPVP